MSDNIGHPVSLASDITVGLTVHWPGDVVELPAPMNHWGGSKMNSHKLTASVFHKKQAIVLDGHNLGFMLDHAPVNHPWVRAKSNRKIGFTASTVMMNAASTGLATAIGSPIGTDVPMMVCGDPISLPNGVNESNAAHTVFVGMTAHDYFKGWAGVAASMVVDAICFPTEVTPAAFVSEVTGVDPAKMGAQVVVNLVASVAVSAHSGWEDPIGTKVEVTNPLMSKSYELTYDQKKGEVVYKQSINELSDLEETTVKWEPGRNRPTQETKRSSGELSKDLDEWNPL